MRNTDKNDFGIFGINLRKLEAKDAEALSEMYRKVEITEKNYIEKLTDTENSFASSGGMFVINDLEKNKKLLSSDNNTVIGGERGGKLCGMICYNTDDRDYPFEDVTFFEDKLAYKETVSECRKKNTLMRGKEIIVLPDAEGPFTFLFFERLLEDALEAGIEYKTGEVYKVDGYEDESGYHECGMMNMPSYVTLLRTGGVPVGTSSQRIVEKEGVRYYITPYVFVWNIKEALEIVNNTLSKKKAGIR